MNTDNKQFSIKEALGFGWHTFKKNASFLVGLVVIYFVSIIVLGLLDTISFGLASMVGSMILSMGAITILLKLADAKKPELSDLFTTYHPFLNYLAATLLYTFMVAIGLILFISFKKSE